MGLKWALNNNIGRSKPSSASAYVVVFSIKKLRTTQIQTLNGL